MLKILLASIFLSISLFAINLQTASKAELMSIKGIGVQKADAIMKYRKTHKLKSAADLKGVKGIGDGIISNVKNNVKVGEKSKAVKKSSSKAKSSKKAASTKVSSKTKDVKKKATDKKKDLKAKASKKTKKVKKEKKSKAKKSKKAKK